VGKYLAELKGVPKNNSPKTSILRNPVSRKKPLFLKAYLFREKIDFLDIP